MRLIENEPCVPLPCERRKGPCRGNVPLDGENAVRHDHPLAVRREAFELSGDSGCVASWIDDGRRACEPAAVDDARVIVGVGEDASGAFAAKGGEQRDVGGGARAEEECVLRPAEIGDDFTKLLMQSSCREWRVETEPAAVSFQRPGGGADPLYVSRPLRHPLIRSRLTIGQICFHRQNRLCCFRDHGELG